QRLDAWCLGIVLFAGDAVASAAGWPRRLQADWLRRFRPEPGALLRRQLALSFRPGVERAAVRAPGLHRYLSADCGHLHAGRPGGAPGVDALVDAVLDLVARGDRHHLARLRRAVAG